MAKIKRYDIKKLLANPDLRRHLIIESTIIAQAREGIDITREEAEKSYYIVTEGERAVFFGLIPFRGQGGDADARHVEFVQALGDTKRGSRFDLAIRDFSAIDGSPLAFDRLALVGTIFRENPTLNPSFGETAQGLATANDPRFVRCWWEVDRDAIGQGKKWVPFAKGGEFSRFYFDVYLVLNWENDGSELKAWAGSLYDNSPWSRILKNTHLYFKSGLNWPRRTAKGLNVRRMPEGCIFSDKGPTIFLKEQDFEPFLLGVTNSRFFEFLFGTKTSFSWESGIMNSMPIPLPSAVQLRQISTLAERAFELKSIWDTGNEICTRFLEPYVFLATKLIDSKTFHQALEATLLLEVRTETELIETFGELNDAIYRLYGISEGLCIKIETAIGDRPPEIIWPQMEGASTEQKRMEHVFRILSYTVKCSLEEDAEGIIGFQPVGREIPLLDRVRAKLASFFPGIDPHTLEIEIINELKKRIKGYARSESLQDWLANSFFDFHCELYKQRPILWHLSSSQDSREPAFSIIVSYHKFDYDLLAKLRSVYARDRMTTLRREAAQAGKDKKEDERLQLLSALEEVEAFDRKLAQLQEGHHEGVEGGDNDYRILTPWKKPLERPKGWHPDINDGVKVNIAPVARTGLLRNKNKFGAKDLED
jgi:hypothetical protein